MAEAAGVDVRLAARSPLPPASADDRRGASPVPESDYAFVGLYRSPRCRVRGEAGLGGGLKSGGL
jgi:hypothetical protein